MAKRFYLLFIIYFIVTLCCSNLLCQNISTKKEAILHYIVSGKDTIFVESIRPSYVWHWKKTNKKEWTKYYRLVHNFGKVYPYALMARVLIHKTDSTFKADELSRRKKDKYISAMQKELFAAFEQPLKNLTISQGQLLMKLVDREVGKSSYNIIKDYKSGVTAFFWQGIAKLFGSDLKKPYDALGADKNTEELIEIWDRGDYPYLYYSIFGQYPQVPSIPKKYRH